ncbi:MAG: FAD-binding oxidoreductase [Methanococcaceae archaeon]
MVSDEKINQLKSSFRGTVILPGEASYDESRKVFNGMIDRHPAIIAKCADVADVISAVNFGRENKLKMSVLGGGHNAGGLGMCDDGLAISLNGLKYTHVDPERETVRVGGGSTWGDVDHATHPFGYAVPSGIISTTGVGGLTLGGGIGHLSRKYGLTIDSLTEADVVLASGKLVKASESENSDLLWALKGGGGNFGVVTSFVFRLNKAKFAYAGPMLWNLDRGEEVMRWYDLFIDEAPLELNGFFMFLSVPPGPPFPENLWNKLMCGVMWYYNGSEEDAQKVFEPIRAMNPAFTFNAVMPHPAIQSMFDPLYPKGLQWYWKADFFNDLNPEVIKEFVKYGSQIPTPLSTIHLYPIHGAVHKVAAKDAAFNFRDAKYSMAIVGVDPDPANKEKITKWTKDYYNAVHPYSTGAAYVNFMMHDEGEERIKATYGSNFNRLLELKEKYDPQNLFCVNQNIVPRKTAELFEEEGEIS